ncbi:MAG: hypothetical protein JNG84_04715 [Archangium sp.]|nr:hypothetical protein [Archangium sp.]
MKLLQLALTCAVLTSSACGAARGGGDDGGALDGGAHLEDGGVDLDAGPWVDVQLNDVSVLFPLPESGAALSAELLPVSASGPRGVLLPSAMYDVVGPISGTSGAPPPGAVGTARYEDLRVVALRIDPCFAALAPPAHGGGCQNQLRLVVQEVVERGGDVRAADSALHLFYSLTRDELLFVAQRLAAVSAGAPLSRLQPHPRMSAEGLSGPAATEVRALIVRFAGATTLTRVTTMQTVQATFVWAFASFDVLDAAGPTLVPMQLPTLPANTTTQSILSGASLGFNVFTSPSTTHTDGFELLQEPSRASQATPAEQAAAHDHLLRVENPALHSPETIDCASCHLATPSTKLVVEPVLSLSATANPNAFAPDTRFVRPSDLAPTFTPTALLNLHAFSYVGRDVGISQRTVNETAAVVAYLNSLVR